MKKTFMNFIYKMLSNFSILDLIIISITIYTHFTGVGFGKYSLLVVWYMAKMDYVLYNHWFGKMKYFFRKHKTD